MAAYLRQQSLRIFLSLLLGFFLMVLPLPKDMMSFWPDWVLLILLYWLMVLPPRIGFFLAWFLGFWVDAIQGTLLGQNSLTFLLMGWMLHFARPHLRHASSREIWGWAFLGLSVARLSHFLIEWFLGDASRWTYHFLTLSVSALIWPWVYAVLKGYCRRTLKPIQ